MWISAGLKGRGVQTQDPTSAPGLLTDDHEEDPDGHLQQQGDADEGDEGGVVLGGRSELQHCFQPHGIGHEERHIQHALGHTLLGGIVVQVDGRAPRGVGVPGL